MYKAIFLLVTSLFLAACGGGDSGSNPPGGGSPPTGSFPAELSGIWQDTLASGGEFTNLYTGITFNMTQGYSAQLKVRPNGEYYFAHYSQGVSSNCALVSFFDQMEGQAELSGSRLILRPRQRRLDWQNCTSPATLNLPLDPVIFDVALSKYETFLDTTVQMVLSGGPYPLKFKLLNPSPPADPAQPPQPQDFQLGTDGPYDEMLGVWGYRDTQFYNPQTGAYQFPGDTGHHRFIRWLPGGYELALAYVRVNFEGVCKKDLIYFEKGNALFKITNQRDEYTYQGDVRLEATQARLIVRIRECGSEDGVQEYTLKPLTSYHRWSYTLPAGGEDFMLGCHYPGHAWSPYICYTSGQGPWYNLERRQ
ncbi:hypothetical protein [Meiothermus sp.]|uniref:hypothetical protein n=1 Tax=Meiothermus sp. TaxID=1955249 RepID=UPI00307E0D50